MIKNIINTDSSPATILIRIMVGAVFLSEGLQKYIYPQLRGAGRFAQIGFPDPVFWGYFVGSVEVVAGTLILIGLFTRIAAIALFIDMSVAILITKIPILLGHGLWIFDVRELAFYNFWSFAHEIRTDWAMWIGSLFLIYKGGGKWSLDWMIAENRNKS